MLLKWAKEVFDIRSQLSRYAFPATAFGAFLFAFLSSLIVGFVYDLEGKDIVKMFYANPFGLSVEFSFWIAVMLFSFLLLIVFEKASKYAVQHPTDLRNAHVVISGYPTRVRGVLTFFFLKGLLLGFALFEYAFDYNLKARLLWIYSFIFWIMGCFLWALQASILGLLFFAMTIISFSIAAGFFYKTAIDSFRNLNRARPLKITYGLIIFLTTILVVFGVAVWLVVILDVLVGISCLFNIWLSEIEKKQVNENRSQVLNLHSVEIA